MTPEPALLEAPEPEADAGAKPSVREWGPVKRLLFRFSFVYLILYCFPFPLNVVPKAEVLTKPIQIVWDAVVPMVGWMAFHAEADNRHNGSGDTTYDWVLVFTYLVVAVLASAVWTRFARRREYSRLYGGLRVYVRFFLVAFMLMYGAAKAIKSQFAFPGLDELLQPIGESSPMGLVWDFMGASTAYTMFSGVVEMLGGFLLAFRRTALAGALVSIGAMINVLMLNLCFDVPVKLFSAHLMLLGVFLTLPHLERLANLFVLHRRVESAEEPPLWNGRWAGRARIAAVACVFVFAAWQLRSSWTDSRQYGDLMPRPPLYGIWRADEMVVDGVARPPLLTDGTRWRYLVFDLYPDFVFLRLMDSSSENGRQFFKLQVDEAKGRMTLAKYRDPKWKVVFTYRRTGDLLDLQGTMDGHAIRARLRRLDETKLLLVGRGFHWINEYPMNH